MITYETWHLGHAALPVVHIITGVADVVDYPDLRFCH